MGDFVDQLLGGQGCAPDGTVANPLSGLVNTLFEGPNVLGGDGQPGAQPYGPTMVLQGPHQGAPAAGAAAMLMGPAGPRMAPTLGAPLGGAWAADFQSGNVANMGTRGGDGGGMMQAAFADAQQQQHSHAMMAAAYQQQGARSGGAGNGMEAAWTGQRVNGPQFSGPQVGGPGGMMMHGGGGAGGGNPMMMMQTQQMQMQQMQQMQMQMEQMRMQQMHAQASPPPMLMQSQPPPPAQALYPPEAYHQQQELAHDGATMGPAQRSSNADGTMQSAAADVASELASNPDPKYAASELHAFASQVARGQDVVLAHAQHQQQPLPNTAAAATDTATTAAAAEDTSSWEDSLPPEVRAKMEAAFNEAMAQGRAADFAEQAEYEAALRNEAELNEWATKLGTATNDHHLHVQDSDRPTQAGYDAAWARTAAALESFGQPPNVALQYSFQPNNQYLGPQAPPLGFDQLFSEGMARFQAGDIAPAIEAFEAALQTASPSSTKSSLQVEDDTHACAEVWRMLGQCHAEHDADPLAITCLERAVAEDPYHLEALLNLGVSYVNELNSSKALGSLRAWVEHNPKYHGLEVEPDEYSDGSLMDDVLQLMQRAEAHSEGRDPDVQVVLGVLYNVTRDFDAAADAFAAAANAKPTDYSMWNKLGATRANSQASAEALPAYHQALALKPRYARGWLNLGISHANLGQHGSAVRAYLHALELNPKAEHIWNYLRIALSSMDRYDLVNVAAQHQVDALRGDFPPIPNEDPKALLLD